MTKIEQRLIDMKVQASSSFLESLKGIGSLKIRYRSAVTWLRYHFKKDFWKIIITAFRGYPWHETFLYELEKAKLQEMINYHKKANRFVGVEYVVRDMQICVNLIDILNDETELFHYTGAVKLVPAEDSDNFEVKADNLEYHCDVNVNVKNIDRFVKNENAKIHYIEYPHELYMLKAKHLYHKIRYERDNEWWD